jgi:hypothetical protein
MGRIIDIIILAFGASIGYSLALMLIGIFSLLFIASGGYIFKSDHKTGTKLFADMTGKQKVSLVLIAIGLIPYIDVIISVGIWVILGNVIDGAW